MFLQGLRAVEALNPKALNPEADPPGGLWLDVWGRALAFMLAKDRSTGQSMECGTAGTEHRQLPCEAGAGGTPSARSWRHSWEQ